MRVDIVDRGRVTVPPKQLQGDKTKHESGQQPDELRATPAQARTTAETMDFERKKKVNSSAGLSLFCQKGDVDLSLNTQDSPYNTAHTVQKKVYLYIHAIVGSHIGESWGYIVT